MHKWAKEIAECLKKKVDGIGIENIDMNELCEIKEWSEIVANIAKFEREYKIVEAMEKEEQESKKGYRGRAANGRYVSRGYEDDYEESRDMDRSDGKMYYMDGRGYSSDRGYSGRRGFADGKGKADKQMKELKDEIEDMVQGMTKDEKMKIQQKLSDIANNL